MKEPLVSAVIPTYNEENVIADCIQTLLSQSYQKLEIIIVDDGSKDKTRGIVKQFPVVKLIPGKHKGPGFSRNLGAKHAKGEILIFVDADMTFDKDYIKYLVKPILKDNSIGTEERHQKSSNLQNIWSRCWGLYVTGDRMNNEKKGLVFRAILKDKFFDLGCFDPKYGYADDLTFLLKYNIKPDLADKAICYHNNPATLRETFNQSKWIGSSLPLHYPFLGKKYLFPLILLSGLSLYSHSSVYLFSKKLVKKQFQPKNPIELLYLLTFSLTRVLGTFQGILKRNISGINYR
jgi:glycosyltransferase involved in cell wall biosynthesis